MTQPVNPPFCILFIERLHWKNARLATWTVTDAIVAGSPSVTDAIAAGSPNVYGSCMQARSVPGRFQEEESFRPWLIAFYLQQERSNLYFYIHAL